MTREHTEVWIELVAAKELHRYQTYGPLFIADSDRALKGPKDETIFRVVSSISEHGGVAGNREQITIDGAHRKSPGVLVEFPHL